MKQLRPLILFWIGGLLYVLIADLEREIEQRKQSREYRSIADKIKANRGTIDQRDRQQEKSRRRSRGMEI